MLGLKNCAVEIFQKKKRKKNPYIIKFWFGQVTKKPYLELTQTLSRSNEANIFLCDGTNQSLWHKANRKKSLLKDEECAFQINILK